MVRCVLAFMMVLFAVFLAKAEIAAILCWIGKKHENDSLALTALVLEVSLGLFAFAAIFYMLTRDSS